MALPSLCLLLAQSHPQLTGLRGAANELDFDPSKSMQVLIGLNPSTEFSVSTNQLLVGQPEHGLYVGVLKLTSLHSGGIPVAEECRQLRQFHCVSLGIHLNPGDGRVRRSFRPEIGPAKLERRHGNAHRRPILGFSRRRELICSNRSSRVGRNTTDGGRRSRFNCFRGQIHTGRKSIVAAFFGPDHGRQWCGRNPGLFSRPSRLGYGDSGFDEPSDAHQRLRHCGL